MFLVRDPARVERISAKLAQAWALYPDLRLGQLVVNLTQPDDPFNVSDDRLEAAVDEFLANPPYVVEELDGKVVYSRAPGEHWRFAQRVAADAAAALDDDGPYPEDPRRDDSDDVA
jgi:hypothetical protein